ncbi:hypothetical protein BJ508DRAFT_320213 [Ascobolus immersus RN42]|uniref:Uncharacterized protein n=1 Tax=Ascobolus immersus RN42 TaxID=1160509 RepID=A0A3N4ITQ2_ASCIM|nr:hypothetical protein BJ508DRAFT_320213 [Ascobolus immersus RN42]
MSLSNTTDPTAEGDISKMEGPPVTDMEALLRKRSCSTTGYARLLRNPKVVPTIPRPLHNEDQGGFVRRNKEALLRYIDDNYLVCRHFYNPVDHYKSDFVLGDFFRPQILAHLGLDDDEAGKNVLMKVFCLYDKSRDYISTTNFVPVYALAGTAFLNTIEHPHHFQLYMHSMGCDPAYHMQARYIVALTPCSIHYPAPGVLPVRMNAQGEKRNLVEKLQDTVHGAAHAFYKKAINANARSIKKTPIDEIQLMNQFVNGLWDRCEELEGMSVADIDWRPKDPESDDE